MAIIALNKALETKQGSRTLATTIPSSGETSSESSAVTVTSTPTTPDPVTIVTPLIMSPSLITTTSTISAPVTESLSTPITRTTSTSAVTPLMFLPSISAVPIPSHSPFVDSSSLSMIPTRTMVSNTSSLGTPTSSSHGTRVKLSKLVPKKFNGDLTKWSTFWDSFESSIHHHPDLSDIDKFNYLCTLLEVGLSLLCSKIYLLFLPELPKILHIILNLFPNHHLSFLYYSLNQ